MQFDSIFWAHAPNWSPIHGRNVVILCVSTNQRYSLRSDASSIAELMRSWPQVGMLQRMLIFPTTHFLVRHLVICKSYDAHRDKNFCLNCERSGIFSSVYVNECVCLMNDEQWRWFPVMRILMVWNGTNIRIYVCLWVFVLYDNTIKKIWDLVCICEISSRGYPNDLVLMCNLLLVLYSRCCFCCSHFMFIYLTLNII